MAGCALLREALLSSRFSKMSCLDLQNLVAEFKSPTKVYTFSSVGDYRIPNVECAHSATKIRSV